MDETSKSLVEELVKLLIYGAVSYLTLTGKSKEDVDKFFSEALKKFKENKPEDLPDV